MRVIPNKHPALNAEGELDREGLGLCDTAKGIGVHEVIVEPPEHHLDMADLPDERVGEVMQTYRQDTLHLKEDERLKYVVVFKNQGRSAGASLHHAHSQLIAAPITPKRVEEKLDGAKR